MPRIDWLNDYSGVYRHLFMAHNIPFATDFNFLIKTHRQFHDINRIPRGYAFGDEKPITHSHPGMKEWTAP